MLRYARAAHTRTEFAAFLTTHGIPADRSASILWWLIGARGGLVHVPPSGTWSHRESGDLIAADVWLRGARAPALAEAVRHAVVRHLAAFGPAAVDDIASWSSIRTPAIRAALVALGTRMRIFSDQRGRMLYDLKGAPLPDPGTPAPVRYLPKWDSTLLAFAPPERVRILAEAHRRTVIIKNGDVARSVLVDGLVAGTWAVAVKRREATITVTPFKRIAKSDAAALTEEGERLARFIAPDATAHRVTFA